MSKALPGGDTQPWFKQFWPWFLIMLPASVVVAGVSMVFIANQHADDLVVDEYYKDGLGINRQLERIERAHARGIDTSLHVQGSHLTVTVSGDVDLEQLQFNLSHPLEADRDIELTLNRIAPGTYYSILPEALSGRWHWRVDSGGEDGWRVDGILEPGDLDAGSH